LRSTADRLPATTLVSGCLPGPPMRDEGEPGGFFGLVGPVLQRALRRQMRTYLEDLKDMLETRGQPQR
jgi:hypothetical protein